ncbi:MAG: helix-turn-helix domain-containing protein [Armatimonadetes bacterium]|nr:helix-turn-helix domain-containing protein [Armatimonadota bacterium]
MTHRGRVSHGTAWRRPAGRDTTAFHEDVVKKSYPTNGRESTEVSPPNQPEKLAYSIPEAAAALGIGVSLLKEMLYCSRIRSVKIGKRRVIPRRELERFLEESSNG